MTPGAAHCDSPDLSESSESAHWQAVGRPGPAGTGPSRLSPDRLGPRPYHNAGGPRRPARTDGRRSPAGPVRLIDSDRLGLTRTVPVRASGHACAPDPDSEDWQGPGLRLLRLRAPLTHNRAAGVTRTSRKYHADMINVKDSDRDSDPTGKAGPSPACHSVLGSSELGSRGDLAQLAQRLGGHGVRAAVTTLATRPSESDSDRVGVG